MSRAIDFRVRLPADCRPTRVVPDNVTARYDVVLNLSEKETQTLSDLHQSLDNSGIERAVVHAEYEFGDPADALNDAVLALINQEPERFAGVGTVSLEPLDIMRALRQVDFCKREGLLGISLQPSFFHLPIDDKRLYPIYAKAAELDLIVFLHTGINYGVTHAIRNDHPLFLDDLACDFPGLRLVACHAGWPWTAEMVAVARKHANVFLEFGGLAPRYVGEPGTGWEIVRRFMDSLLHEQVLFGTDWPVIDHQRALREWRAMGLKTDTLDNLLHGNAMRLLGTG